MEALERKGWKLTHIINTHHHHDHAGGNLELKKRTGCTILGASLAKAAILRVALAVLPAGKRDH